MTIKTLYTSEHPHITITHDINSGDVVLNRTDRFMRNTHGTSPPFVPEQIILINTKEEIYDE